MCSISPYYFQAFHFKAAGVWAILKPWPVVLAILGILSIGIIVRAARRPKKRNARNWAMLFTIVGVLFAWTIIGLTYIGITVGDCSYTPKYLSSREFVDTVGSAGTLYHQAVFEKHATLSLKGSNWTFACANDLCKEQTTITKEGQRLQVNARTQGVLFTCAESPVIWLHASTIRSAYADLENASSTIPPSCENQQELAQMPELGRIPLSDKYARSSLCQSSSCITSQALYTRDESICAKIADTTESASCRQYVQAYLHDPTLDANATDYRKYLLIESGARISNLTFYEQFCLVRACSNCSSKQVWPEYADARPPAEILGSIRIIRYNENDTQELCSHRVSFRVRTDREGRAIVERQLLVNGTKYYYDSATQPEPHFNRESQQFFIYADQASVQLV